MGPIRRHARDLPTRTRSADTERAANASPSAYPPAERMATASPRSHATVSKLKQSLNLAVVTSSLTHRRILLRFHESRRSDFFRPCGTTTCPADHHLPHGPPGPDRRLRVAGTRDGYAIAVPSRSTILCNDRPLPPRRYSSGLFTAYAVQTHRVYRVAGKCPFATAICTVFPLLSTFMDPFSRCETMCTALAVFCDTLYRVGGTKPSCLPPGR